MVRDGRLYDELSDSEKNAYSAYWGVSRKALEDCNTAVNGSLNFPLRLKPNEPLTKIVCDVENCIKSNK